jgi:hypothetical protein
MLPKSTLANESELREPLADVGNVFAGQAPVIAQLIAGQHKFRKVLARQSRGEATHEVAPTELNVLIRIKSELREKGRFIAIVRANHIGTRPKPPNGVKDSSGRLDEDRGRTAKADKDRDWPRKHAPCNDLFPVISPRLVECVSAED